MSSSLFVRPAEGSVLINSYFTAEETDEEILWDYRTWQRQLRTHLLGPDLNLRVQHDSPRLSYPPWPALRRPPEGGGAGESEGYVTPSRILENLLPGPGNFKCGRRNWLPSFGFGCWLVLPIWLTDRGFRIFSRSRSLSVSSFLEYVYYNNLRFIQEIFTAL